MRNVDRPIPILFFTPAFGRTGSEVLLLYLLQGMDRKAIIPYLYSMQDGELLQELPVDVPYFLPYYTRKKRGEKLWRSLLKRLKKDPFEYQLKAIQKKIKADIWYINTIIVDSRVLEVGKQLGVKIVTHFHELPNAYRMIRQEHLQSIIDHSDMCIGCSKIVCEKIRDMGHRNVQLLYSFIDDEAIKPQVKKSTIVRSDLGIPDDTFVWVISGSVIYEKGLDYLLSILEAMQDEKFQIIWLGQRYENGLFYYIKTVTEKRWPGKLIFTGPLKEKYYQYLMLADGLLMPSREDSFSLVMLEAAYLGKPIVSFNSGGVKEFVDENRGIVVDSWNATDLAEAMKKVMHSKKKGWSANGISEFTLNHQINHFQELITSQR